MSLVAESRVVDLLMLRICGWSKGREGAKVPRAKSDEHRVLARAGEIGDAEQATGGGDHAERRHHCQAGITKGAARV